MGDWFPASDDPKLMGRFVDHPIINKKESENKGEPVYSSVPILQLRPKGSKDIATKRMKPETGEELIARFPQSWAAYQGEVVAVDGQPLMELPGLSPEKAAAWSIVGVRTIEDLASAEDAELTRLGFGARDHQKNAQNLLAAKETPQKRKRGRPRKELAEQE